MLDRKTGVAHDRDMKTSPLCLATLLALFLAPFTRADLTLNTETATEEGKHPSVIKICDRGMRIEHPMGVVLLLPQDHKILMINRQMQSVMEMPLPEKAGDQAGPMSPKFVKTGNKETISGLVCEEIVMTDPAGTKTRFWVSPQGPDPAALASFTAGLQSMAKGGPGSSFSMKEFALAGNQLGGFPIRTVAGSVTNTVLSFSSAAVPASEFEIPSGYRKMTMPALPSMAPGMSIPKDAQKALQQMQKNGMPGGLTPEQMRAIKEATKGLIPEPGN